jgi:hypothetical protein
LLQYIVNVIICFISKRAIHNLHLQRQSSRRLHRITAANLSNGTLINYEVLFLREPLILFIYWRCFKTFIPNDSILWQLSFSLAENHNKLRFNTHHTLALICPRLFFKPCKQGCPRVPTKPRRSHCACNESMTGWREQWALRPGHFAPGERAAVTRFVRGCVGPKTDMDTGETTKPLLLQRIAPRFFTHPARTLVTTLTDLSSVWYLVFFNFSYFTRTCRQEPVRAYNSTKRFSDSRLLGDTEFIAYIILQFGPSTWPL